MIVLKNLDRTDYPCHLKTLNHVYKSLVPSKVMFTGSGDKDVDVFLISLSQSLTSFVTLIQSWKAPLQKL